MLSYWKREIAHNPFVAAIIGAFIVSTGMNISTGYVLSNGSLAVAGVLGSIAILTTYAGTVAFTGARTGRKLALMAFLPLGLAVDQFSSWQTMGIQFADGQVVRERAATKGETTAELLEQARSDRKAISETEPVAALAARRALECKIVSKRYPDGEGPKCTEWKAREAAAIRARDLEAEIAELQGKLAKAPAVASGQAQFAVPVTLANAASSSLAGYFGGEARTFTGEDIRFAILVLMSALLGVLANLGFWLIGFTGSFPEPGAAETNTRTASTGEFNVASLPAPPRRTALPRHGGAHGSRVFDAPSPSMPGAHPAGGHSGGQGGGVTNNITVGGAPQALPARAAARLAVVNG